MRNGTNGAAGDRLREAQRQWELWRLRCRGPGRIPKELWRLAAEAAAEHGVESTARKLRLNSERLERLQSAVGIPLPASVQCEWTQRALERGHYPTEVQRHEEQVTAAPARWLPWNDQEQLAESFLQRNSALA